MAMITEHNYDVHEIATVHENYSSSAIKNADNY